MYQENQAEGAQGAPGQAPGDVPPQGEPNADAQKKDDDNIVDADFKVVDDK
jgi:hypothetical protein